MAINFNSDPYYDDYNESKNFHSILFKPGVAVQARELNQLQTILQNQVTRFGNHTFKPGSVVIPGNLVIDKTLNYVKLLTTYNSADIDVQNYLNREIQGQTTGIRAKVIKVDEATDTDPPTIYVKYLDSGTNYTTTAFANSETFETVDTGTTYYATTEAASATGKSSAASISTGVFFVKDRFVRVDAQTVILQKYGIVPSYRVGLYVTEDIINSDSDESLLDPAIGTYNYFAPGADRYRVLLTLTKRTLEDNVTSDNFIELGRVENGDVISITDKPGYNILADELARRTYDESGDYTVKPFNLKIIEHLKDSNNRDGYLTSNQGGNGAYGIAVISPGKSYVKGYEVSTISNTYLPFNKPRDSSNVTNAIVRTPIGNYLEVSNTYGIPNFTSDLININLYNKYTSTKGSASGTLVGNARIRGYETGTGNVMLSSSTMKAFLFDVQMIKGYTFDRDVKSLYQASVSDTGYVSTAFTSDVVPTDVSITGSVTLTNNSNTVTGVNTLFTSELKVGDYVQFTSDTNSYYVSAISTNTDLTIGRTYPLANVAGVNATRDSAVITDADLSTYIFPFANDVINNISDITLRTRRVSYGTLSTGNIDISTAVNSTFASRSDTDYFAVAVTGSKAGNVFYVGSNNFEYTDGTFRNIRIKLTSYGLTNEDVLVYGTVIKSNPSAKTKTSTDGSTTLTSKTDCESAVISLSNADAYAVSNIRMSSNVFGTAYNDSNAVDITDNYTLVTGQTPTYYGISSIKLKPGKPLPTGPVKVSYKYYAHGAGDYFSEASYPNYEDIPTFVDNGVTYNLRDSLDFRPRISNDGANFKGTGAVRTEFIDYSNDFQCDYTYYLPRIDKIYITNKGEIVYKEGTSSLNPAEPVIQDQSMPLYVIEHPAYGFDINRDSKFTPLDQKRYTMKDIGKLENRIKNLEYYTTLSLLELDTAIFSVKDQFGLDRFKNGFIVDSFTGHGIGDVRNLDYNVSMDFGKGELLPSFKQSNFKLAEVNTVTSDRTANGYTLVNDTIMLSYTDEEYATNSVASSDQAINPFDIYIYTGSMTLTPSSDSWYDTTTKPLIYKNDNGEYDTLIPDSVGEKTYGSVWNSWKQFWYNPSNTDKAKTISGGVVLTEASVNSDASNVVFPYARAVNIKFTASRLKPRTKYYAFFNEYNVTNFCFSPTGTGNVSSFVSEYNNQGVLVSDNLGTVTGYLRFDPAASGLKIPTGTIKLRLTDSPTDATSKESFADAYFISSGTLTKQEPPRINYVPQSVIVNQPIEPVSSGSGDYVTTTSTTTTSKPWTTTKAATTTTTSAPGTTTTTTAAPEDPKTSTTSTTTTSTTSTTSTSTTGTTAVTVNPGFTDLAVAFITDTSIVSTEKATLSTFESTLRSTDGFNETTFLANLPTSTSTYNTIDLRTTNAYDFVSGASVTGDAATTELPSGLVMTDYWTATNIMDARNADTNDLFIADIYNSVSSDKWNSVIVPVFEATKAATAEVVAAGKPTADMLSFYQAGLANGSWSETEAGISKAIENYAAALTLGFIDGQSATAATAASVNKAGSSFVNL